MNGLQHADDLAMYGGIEAEILLTRPGSEIATTEETVYGVLANKNPVVMAIAIHVIFLSTGRVNWVKIACSPQIPLLAHLADPLLCKP